MGRGERSQNQAISFTRAPRAKRAGQKRYQVYYISYTGEKILWQDVGLMDRIAYNEYDSLVIGEEVAVPDDKGRLRWVQTGRQSARRQMIDCPREDVARLAKEMNELPLGRRVIRRVRPDGLLEVGIETIALENGESEKELPSLIASQEELEVFHPDRDQKRAERHYQQLAGEIADEQRREVETFAAVWRRQNNAKTDSKLAERIVDSFDSPDSELAELQEEADRARKAAAAAEQSARSEAERAAELAREAEEAAKAEAERAEQIYKARRAKETLRSLAGS